MDWVPIVFLTFKAVVLFTGMFFAIKWHYDQDRKDKNEASGPQSSAEMRLFATMIIVLAMSLIGIVYAGCWGDAAEGGRGGALGFGFTAFMLFMSKAMAGLTDRRDDAGHLQADVNAEPDPATLSVGLEQLTRLKRQTEQLRADLVIRLDAIEREKVYFGVASVASTLAWKFGDLAAGRLKF